MQVKYGIVKFAADREFPNQFRPGEFQQSLTLTMDDGTEERLWFKTGRVPHATLKKGDRAGVLYETNQQGKQIRKLVVDETIKPKGTPPMQPSQNYIKTAMTVEQKREWIMNTVAAYGEIFVAVENYFRTQLGYKLSEESIRTIATSIAINFDKKFPNESLKLTEVEEVKEKRFETASEQVAHQPVDEDFDFEG